MPANVENSAPTGVRGWLLILSRVLIVYQPVALAVSASHAIDSLAVRGAPLVFGLAVRVVATALCVAAGLALTNQHASALPLARVALIASAACDVFVVLTSFLPNNIPPGDEPVYVAATLVFHGGWLVYLSRSRRVRNTYE